jgi:hypothetical protein
VTSLRTEDDGEAGILRITVGGQPVELRVLTIAESDDWKDQLARRLAAMDIVDPGADGGALLSTLFRVGADARLDMLVAYDVDHVLGDRESLRRRLTQAELARALDLMVEAEGPFGMADARSVAEAFGKPLQVAAGILRALEDLSAPASSPSGPSSTGDSPTPTSDDGGPGSSSSSAGPMPSSDSIESPGSSAT